MALEIECKFLVTDSIHAAVLSHAVLIKPRIFEQNIRYESPLDDLIPNDIVLRLRHDEQTRLTYKAPTEKRQEGLITRLELETTVGDHAAMHAILQHLGFKPYMIYEKYRTTYRLLTFPKVEIVFDEMPYGNFIEIEGEAEQIEQAIEHLGLKGVHRILKSYSQLFEIVRRHHGLTFTDLTFKNFEGITIDLTIFKQA